MNYLFKVCLVGDSGTGKTTFIESLVKNFYYESKEQTVAIGTRRSNVPQTSIARAIKPNRESRSRQNNYVLQRGARNLQKAWVR